MPIEKLDEFAKNGQKSTEGVILENGFPQEEKPARQWFNYIFNAISIKTNELIDFSQTNADAISGINTEIEDLNLARFDTGISVTSTYPEQVIITQSEKNSEYLSFEQFGAVGDGVTDDTVAIEKALNSGASILSSKKDYVFSGDLDLLYSSGAIGSGKIVYDGYKYPIVKEKLKNFLWQSEYSSWDKGYAATLSNNSRIHMPIGITHARTNFSNELTVYSSLGLKGENSVRLQRNPSSSKTEPLNTVLSMSEEETRPLLGKQVTFQYNLDVGEDYSGSNITCQAQCSLEPEQPIISSEGAYSGDFEVLETSSHLAVTRDANTPYFITFTVPTDAIQISIRFEISFSGTAGDEDYIALKDSALSISDNPFIKIPCNSQEVVLGSSKRYQTSYPYGTISVPTEQGSVQSICTSTLANYSAIITVRFYPKMIVAPSFYFQSPTSGVKFRIKNMRTGSHINGMAFDLSDTGVTITNNATVQVGDRLLCHYVAECII